MNTILIYTATALILGGDAQMSNLESTIAVETKFDG